MFIEHLSPDAVLVQGARARAVGWLSALESYPRGEVPPGFLTKLQTLIDDGWVPALSTGPHACELCETDPAMNADNVLVPTHDRIYAAPGMIVHHVEEHRYLPPHEFVDAVFACPLPGTDEYSNLLRGFLGMWGGVESADVFEESMRAHQDALQLRG